jgi:hypothetical protein
MATLPRRTWRGIALRAYHLKLHRNHGPNRWKPWSAEDDDNLVKYYESDMEIQYIAYKLGRSLNGVRVRMKIKGLVKSQERCKKATWEISNLMS